MATKEEKNSFSLMIETMAVECNITHMEAILHFCEEKGMEIEVAASLINQSLKAKIEEEAKDLKFLPRGSRLPI